jgi:ABC-2 type transport system permease protein
MSAAPRPGLLRATLAVLSKELLVLFLAPTAWVFLAAFLLATGLFFTVAIGTTGEASLRPALPNLGVTLLFCLPFVTMRQLAAEDREGTLELLITAPVPLAAIVLGKWLAAVCLGLVLLALTFPFPLVLVAYGDPDPGIMFTSYLGLALCVATFTAAGLLASSITREPLVAGMFGIVLLLPSWLAGAAGEVAPPKMRAALDGLSLVAHLRSFSRGVIDTADLAFFVAATALFLFLAWRSLDARRWR